MSVGFFLVGVVVFGIGGVLCSSKNKSLGLVLMLAGTALGIWGITSIHGWPGGIVTLLRSNVGEHRMLHGWVNGRPPSRK